MGKMQLYILGPAFGLPSIDAECIAAVAFLQLHLKNGYELLPTHDQRRKLPLLRHGDSIVSGFGSIVKYLAAKHVFDEAGTLSDQQNANSIAATAFVDSHASLLLDISLYVSFENYRLSTRPAFTKILPWHSNYIIPPQRRGAARLRTEHLGVSGIDVDNVHEDMSHRPPGFDGVGREEDFEAATQKRASLLLPRKDTIKSLLQRSEGGAAIFKLHALADNVFEPLQEILGDGDYMLGSSEARALDCLVYGYLSLMLYPKLPQSWLSETLRRKYKKLFAYTERLHDQFSLSTRVEDVMALSQCSSHDQVLEKRQACKTTLPWNPPMSTSVSETFATIARGIFDQIPMAESSTSLALLDTPRRNLLESHLPALLFASSASAAALGYLALRIGLVSWPRGESVHIFGRKRFSDFGHLGAALSGLDFA